MEKNKKKFFSIKVKLLLIALLPSIILSLVLGILASANIKTGMQEEALHGLRGAAYSLLEIFESTDPGDYEMDASGNIRKGDLMISDNYEIVDTLNGYTEYDFTLFYGDTRITTSLTDIKTGDRLVGTTASDKVVETVLKNGKEFSDTSVVINGESYYAYYVPITQDDEVIGMAFAGLPSQETDSYILKKEITLFVICDIVLIAIIIIGLVFALNLSHALAGAENTIKEMARGNLTVRVDEKTKKRFDEVGSMTRELETLINELVNVISNVKNSSKVLFTSGTSLEEMANQTSDTTNEISRAVEDISRGAMTQAEETEAASSNIIEMGNIITEIVSSVGSLDNTSRDMKDASDNSTVIIKELTLSNDKTTKAIDKIGQQVHTTNDSVQSIRQAVELITSIATETNLLSLNASIEAARAGEHGRGFAVVASQIQKLAEESNSSAQEIDKIIDQLLEDSEQTVKVMDEVNVIVNEQRQKLTQTTEKFLLVTEGVNSTRKETEIIGKQSRSCDQARARIMDVIQDLSAISQENAASTQETNASMEELNATLNLLAEAAKDLLALSTELEKNMEFFQI